MKNEENLFTYTQSSKAIAPCNIILGGILLFGSAVLVSILLWSGIESFWLGFILPIFILALFLSGAIYLFGGIIWWTVKGKWEISITDKEISWQTPLFSEASFKVEINEVKHIVKLTKPGGGDSEPTIEYYLIDTNKNIHTLHTQSGVDLGEFLLVLKRMGIKSKSVFGSYSKVENEIFNQ